jgi:hypothetical protein
MHVLTNEPYYLINGNRKSTLSSFFKKKTILNHGFRLKMRLAACFDNGIKHIERIINSPIEPLSALSFIYFQTLKNNIN